MYEAAAVVERVTRRNLSARTDLVTRRDLIGTVDLTEGLVAVRILVTVATGGVAWSSTASAVDSIVIVEVGVTAGDDKAVHGAEVNGSAVTVDDTPSVTGFRSARWILVDTAFWTIVLVRTGGRDVPRRDLFIRRRSWPAVRDLSLAWWRPDLRPTNELELPGRCCCGIAQGMREGERMVLFPEASVVLLFGGGICETNSIASFTVLIGISSAMVLMSCSITVSLPLMVAVKEGSEDLLV